MSAERELNYGELGESLGFQLARASVPAYRTFESQVGRVLKLRRAEYSVLVLLRSNSRVTAKVLATALSISPPNMSVLLDKLAERGLVQRVPDERDKRSQVIDLTGAGRLMADQAAATGAGMERSMLAVLSDTERKMLFDMLSRIGALHLLG